MVASGFTVMVPPEVTSEPHGPVAVIVYAKEPSTVGDPLMVNVFPVSAPITPAGSPLAVTLLTVPVVEYTMFTIGVLIQTD
ncbi:hypothetical protein DSECCO2_407510 [anaerobic digester metagenome]